MIAVVRNLYTFLKNLKPKVSQYTDAHYWAERHELMNPSRFDTIVLAIKKQSHKTLHNSNYNELMQDYSQKYLSPSKLSKSVSTKGRVVGVTSKDIKQQLMRGSFNILGKVNNLDPATSSYMAVYKGLNPKTSTITKPLNLA